MYSPSNLSASISTDLSTWTKQISMVCRLLLKAVYRPGSVQAEQPSRDRVLRLLLHKHKLQAGADSKCKDNLMSASAGQPA